MSAIDELLAQGRAAALPAAGTVVAQVAQAVAAVGVWFLGRPDRAPGRAPPVGYYSDEVEQPYADWRDVYGEQTRWD